MQCFSVAPAELEGSAKESQVSELQRVAGADEASASSSPYPGTLTLAFDDSVKELLVQYLERL